MATIKAFTAAGEAGADIAFDDAQLTLEKGAQAVKDAVTAIRNSMRAGTASTKSKGEVAGSNKKPWKQKGTGRARAGSNRSPVWRGGAIIFGPQPRDYSFKVNRKVRALALRMALSSRVAANDCLVVKEISLPDGKTKNFAKVAKALGLTKALVVAPELTENLDRSSRNLPNVTLTTPERLSVYEILKNKQLVLLQDAIAPVQARFVAKGE